jgi:hypothetical protein
MPEGEKSKSTPEEGVNILGRYFGRIMLNTFEVHCTLLWTVGMLPGVSRMMGCDPCSILK